MLLIFGLGRPNSLKYAQTGDVIYFTKSDAMDCYGIENSGGIEIDGVTIISKVIY